jgi:hypothetical protein
MYVCCIVHHPVVVIFGESCLLLSMKGGIDKGSTATATTGHAVAAGKGEAYFAVSVRCHFRLSTVMMDKDTSPAPYIQKKDAASK